MSKAQRPLAHDPLRPLALVLSGGGARGAFQVGVWKILRSDPRGFCRLPSVVSGTSAGAINAVLLAAGLSPEAMLEFWLDLAERPPVRTNERFFSSLQAELARVLFREPLRAFDRRTREVRLLVGLLRKHTLLRLSGIESMLVEFLLTARFDTVSNILDAIQTRYLFDFSPLAQRLEKALGRGGLRTEMRLALNTVDAHTGMVVRIVNHRPIKRDEASARHYRYEPVITPEMVMASAAIPLLFNPISLGAQELWDGGLLVNTPMAPAVALGARRLIPVLVTPKRSPGKPEECFGAAVEHLADAFLENAYNADRKLLLERNTLAQHLRDPGLHVVELFEAIRPESSRTFNAGSYLYFERKALLAMHEAGQRAARTWLDRGPPRDSHDEDD
ncbi:MAG: patatin-like phospholipase family protein [Myxococcales bacterium]|nr:patatin-like phospholipase family protein [Polyangiaceae bacterium]MDW8250082.1 patatin-like phospholipase family protein [Myxococcales bacterium]